MNKGVVRLDLKKFKLATATIHIVEQNIKNIKIYIGPVSQKGLRLNQD